MWRPKASALHAAQLTDDGWAISALGTKPLASTLDLVVVGVEMTEAVELLPCGHCPRPRLSRSLTQASTSRRCHPQQRDSGPPSRIAGGKSPARTRLHRVVGESPVAFRTARVLKISGMVVATSASLMPYVWHGVPLVRISAEKNSLSKRPNLLEERCLYSQSRCLGRSCISLCP